MSTLPTRGYEKMEQRDRIASQFGTKAIRTRIEGELNRRFPPDQFRVDIRVIGDESHCPVVCISDDQTHIRISEKVVLQVEADTIEPTLKGTIDTATRLMSKFEGLGELQLLDGLLRRVEKNP
jgi:hypothetical protein